MPTPNHPLGTRTALSSLLQSPVGSAPVLGEQIAKGSGKAELSEGQPHIIKSRSHYLSDGCTTTHVKPAYGPRGAPQDQDSSSPLSLQGQNSPLAALTLLLLLELKPLQENLKIIIISLQRLLTSASESPQGTGLQKQGFVCCCNSPHSWAKLSANLAVNNVEKCKGITLQTFNTKAAFM